MVDIKEKKECMGCSACKEICPKKCITMKEDYEGFLYPEIDHNKCIECNLCSKTCPMINPNKENKKSKEVYGAVNKDKKVLLNSSSGGVFTELAKQIIKDGGVVIGSSLDDDLIVKHIEIDNEKDIEKLQGSKYVQSDMNSQYKNVKLKLEQGIKVLFSGTPCQVSGLYHYLKKDYDNLITCDFVCTGVPSPKIFKLYRSQYDKNNNVVNVKFRNKKNGWVSFGMLFEYKDGNNKYICRYNDKYILSFYSHLTLRPACYNCKFKLLLSGSDIKLADYWLVKNRYPEFYNFDGVSHVMINTEKGKCLFDKVKDNFNLIKSSYNDVLEDNLSFSKVVEMPKEREEIFSLLKKDQQYLFMDQK